MRTAFPADLRAHVRLPLGQVTNIPLGVWSTSRRPHLGPRTYTPVMAGNRAILIACTIAS